MSQHGSMSGWSLFWTFVFAVAAATGAIWFATGDSTPKARAASSVEVLAHFNSVTQETSIHVGGDLAVTLKRGLTPHTFSARLHTDTDNKIVVGSGANPQWEVLKRGEAPTIVEGELTGYGMVRMVVQIYTIDGPFICHIVRGTHPQANAMLAHCEKQ